MPFKRYYDNERIAPRISGEESPRPFAWYLSDSAVEASIAGATIAFSVILIVIWLINARFTVDQSDIQTAAQISAGLGALSLAVPLFLRDFRVQETLWRSFLILSSIFLVSTCVGFVAFLLQSTPEEVKLTFAGFISIIVVSNFRTGVALQRLGVYHKNKIQHRQNLKTNYISVHISPTKPLEFLLVMLLVLVCIFTSHGLPAAFLLLFSYGIMLLLATLSASIISAFTHRTVRTSAEEAKYGIKTAIQEVLEQNPHKAFTEQELLDTLREGPYKGYSELISRSAVQIAVSEMDIEDRENEPKATIWEYDKVIPRWNDIYNEHAFKLAPSILVFKPEEYPYYYYNNVKDILPYLKDKKSENLLAAISEKSGLSIELLKDGNMLARILQRFDKIWGLELEGKYKIAHIEGDIKKLKLVPYSLSNEKIDRDFKMSLLDLIGNLQKLTWFADEVNKNKRPKLLIAFTEHILLNQPNVFAPSFIKDEDLLEVLSRAPEGMRQYSIKEYFKELLLEELPGSSPLIEIAEEIINSVVEEKLEKLKKDGLISRGRRHGSIIWKENVDKKNSNEK